VTHWDYIGLAVYAGCLGATCICAGIGLAIAAGAVRYSNNQTGPDSARIFVKMTFALIVTGLLFSLMVTSVIYGGK
jgi:hypothetical protein